MTDKGDGVRVVGYEVFYENSKHGKGRAFRWPEDKPAESFTKIISLDPLILAHDEADRIDDLRETIVQNGPNGLYEYILLALRTHAKELRGLK